CAYLAQDRYATALLVRTCGPCHPAASGHGDMCGKLPSVALAARLWRPDWRRRCDDSPRADISLGHWSVGGDTRDCLQPVRPARCGRHTIHVEAVNSIAGLPNRRLLPQEHALTCPSSGD